MIVERRNSHQPDSHDLLSEIREIMNEPIPFALEEILALRYTARAVIHQDDVFTKITVSMEDIKHEEENNLRFQNSSKKLRALMQKYRDINPFPIRDTPEDINFCREVAILASNSNPFIVPFIGFNPEEHTIMTKFMPNGSLDNYLNNEKQLNPTQLTIIAAGIAHALARIHETGIIYRDVKPQNILLDEKMYPIICDFGISRDFTQVMTHNTGTLCFMAPEQITTGIYDQKADVY